MCCDSWGHKESDPTERLNWTELILHGAAKSRTWLRDWIHTSRQILHCLSHQGIPIFPSTKAFFTELALHIRWPKYWSFNFSISSSNEYSGLISFRMDWLDFLAVRGTLKSLLQRHSSKHQLFGAQLSLWSNSHIHTWLLEKPELWLYGPISVNMAALLWKTDLIKKKKTTFYKCVCVCSVVAKYLQPHGL